MDFCTCTDSAFVSRALALEESLRRHRPDARLWVLCLDAASREGLRAAGLSAQRLVPLADLEADDPALAEVRPRRTPLEYALTLRASWLLHLFRREPGLGLVTCLDADLFFFSDPQPILDELGPGSALLVGHRFPPGRGRERLFGAYNDGWVSVRGDGRGLACLRWWRERCLEWCGNRAEEGRFTGQKYLDEWPRLFPGVSVSTHPGANVGPWNLESHRLALGPEGPTADGRPLVFYHFSGLARLGPGLYALCLDPVRLGPEVRGGVYAPYLRALRSASRRLPPALARSAIGSGGLQAEGRPRPLGFPGRPLLRAWRQGRVAACVAGMLL